MISVPSDHKNFAPYFMALDMFQWLVVYSLETLIEFVPCCYVKIM